MQGSPVEATSVALGVMAEPSEQDRRDAEEARRMRVGQACKRNAAKLPMLAGPLTELQRGMLGRETEVLRWVVLEPASRQLCLWDRPPACEVEEGSGFPTHGRTFLRFSCSSASKEPRKTFSLHSLVEVDFNARFRNIFLRFEHEKDVLCLTAADEAVFRQWMSALGQYDAAPPEANTIREVGRERSSRTPIPWQSTKPFETL